MITAIVSNVKEVNVQLSFDEVLGKYCLEVCTNDGIVEMILGMEALLALVRQLERVPEKLSSVGN